MKKNASQAAQEYAQKKKDQLERANKIKAERNAQSSGSTQRKSHMDSLRPQNEMAIAYANLEGPNPYIDNTSLESVKISKENYEFVDHATHQAKAKERYDKQLAQRQSQSLSSVVNDPSKNRITASSIISSQYRLSAFRTNDSPNFDCQWLFNPPPDPSGAQVDASDRPLLCLSSNMRDEVIAGGADHALYAVNISNPSTSPPRAVTMYTKTYGHTDWVTGVAHLPNGAVKIKLKSYILPLTIIYIWKEYSFSLSIQCYRPIQRHLSYSQILDPYYITHSLCTTPQYRCIIRWYPPLWMESCVCGTEVAGDVLTSSGITRGPSRRCYFAKNIARTTYISLPPSSRLSLPPYPISLSPQVLSDTVSNTAVSLGYDGKLLIWSLDAPLSPPPSPAASLLGHTSPLLEACLCGTDRSGRTMAVIASGDKDGAVILWNGHTAEIMAR
jgi:hypothetical protein